MCANSHKEYHSIKSSVPRIIIIKQTQTATSYFLKRFIPQGRVDNNLGPDSFACQEPRSEQLQIIHPLIAHPLSGSPNCEYLWNAHLWHFPYSYYFCRKSDKAAVRTTLTLFSYDAVWPERIEANNNHKLMRYMLIILFLLCLLICEKYFYWKVNQRKLCHAVKC